MERELNRHSDITWVWAVHCETSAGVLNDMLMLKEFCAERNTQFCLDGISSIGAVPVNLHNVYLASGVSGEGLGGLSGLAMVFYHHMIRPAPKLIPRYLDLGLYAACKGIPFTHSSNLIAALRVDLERRDRRIFGQDQYASALNLRSKLREMGFTNAGSEGQVSPTVVTIALPKRLRSLTVGLQLERAGYLLDYRSEYLVQQNWISLSLIKNPDPETMTFLLDALEAISKSQGRW
jgi:aspartate aminotransferase-like enzyme